MLIQQPTSVKVCAVEGDDNSKTIVNFILKVGFSNLPYVKTLELVVLFVMYDLINGLILMLKVMSDICLFRDNGNVLDVVLFVLHYN